ncbi:MAG: WbqC family protein [Saprospiraceae bacterium]
MQSYLLPYLGYFQLISCVDKFIIYDNLDYIYQGWINRNRLLNKNGHPFYFTIPVSKGKASTVKISEVLIYHDYWKRKMLNSVLLNYSRSQFYSEVIDIINRIVEFESNFISDFNKHAIKIICEYLDIKTHIVYNSDFSNVENEMSTKGLGTTIPYLPISFRPDSIKSLRVVLICKHFSCIEFVNPVGGKELYSKKEFSKNSIKLRFLEMKNFKYAQPSKCFHSHLSIIDVLMNCGKEKTKLLLEEYNLI